MAKAKVYFTKEISPESLIKIYEALGVELKSCRRGLIAKRGAISCRMPKKLDLARANMN